MSQVISNPTPKARFQAIGKLQAHRELVALPIFELASDFAVLQYESQLAQGPFDFNACASNHLKIRGALEFLQVFRNLAESATIPAAVRPVDNLDHKA